MIMNDDDDEYNDDDKDNWCCLIMNVIDGQEERSSSKVGAANCQGELDDKGDYYVDDRIWMAMLLYRVDFF